MLILQYTVSPGTKPVLLSCISAVIGPVLQHQQHINFVSLPTTGSYVVRLNKGTNGVSIVSFTSKYCYKTILNKVCFSLKFSNNSNVKKKYLSKIKGSQ